MKKLVVIVFAAGMLAARAQPPGALQAGPPALSVKEYASGVSYPSSKPAADTQQIHSKRKWIVGSTSAMLYAGSLVLLNNAWYKDYPKTSFHVFNDGAEWLQVDKVGHAWSAYNLSRVSTAAWEWAYGQKHNKKAALLGTLSGFSYLTVIEFLDAHSSNWGWSWPDMAANTLGSGLFATQELLWKEQRVQFKFSSHRNSYSAMLEQRANSLYGSSLPERILKDYNAQSYWFSFRLKSFFPQSRLPAWLSLSVGYGAEGLFGGFSNRGFDEDGNLIFDRPDIKRYRQWHLSPDIDLTQIRTRSKLLRTLLAGLNAIKIPAPALEFSNNKFRLKGLAF